jgi:hypothetical protein
MPTGPTQPVALAATSVTITLAQFVTSAIYAPQVAFWNIGAAAANSIAFVAFGSGTQTVSTTIGTPIVPLSSIAPATGSNDTGMQILTTGKSPINVAVIGSAGTTTVFVTPGEGSR